MPLCRCLGRSVGCEDMFSFFFVLDESYEKHLELVFFSHGLSNRHPILASNQARNNDYKNNEKHADPITKVQPKRI